MRGAIRIIDDLVAELSQIWVWDDIIRCSDGDDFPGWIAFCVHHSRCELELLTRHPVVGDLCSRLLQKLAIIEDQLNLLPESDSDLAVVDLMILIAEAESLAVEIMRVLSSPACYDIP